MGQLSGVRNISPQTDDLPMKFDIGTKFDPSQDQGRKARPADTVLNE